MTTDTTNPFEHYRNIHSKRTSEELQLLARIKRFIEVLAGVSEFRDALLETPDQADAIAKSYGLEVEMDKLSPFWIKGARPSLPPEELEGFEQAQLWRAWMNDLIRFRDLVRDYGSTPDNPAYDAWRSRQMARCNGELGDQRRVIVHANVAYELSKGCSVGCWFCGLKSDSFEGYFPRTPENIQLWRETLGIFKNYLGSAAETGFCYWATEPSDNPAYLDFVEDYHDVLGVLPQTTTARSTKDMEWTRRLVNLHRTHLGAPARFSVISRKMLKELHAAFTPDELMGVELVQQHRDSLVVKAQAGRLLGSDEKGKATEETGTIACVSGFFVNMMERSVQLVSPCRSSERWPAGYRIHAEGQFETPSDLQDWLEVTTRECMPESMPTDVTLRFRKDLAYESAEDGFKLSGTHSRVSLNGGAHARIGEMVSRGNMTYDDIFSSLVSELDFFTVTGALQTLYDRGLLDDGEDGGAFNVRSA